MELVAADPDVISPTLIEFDGNGRMYVGEMISYMMDADATPRARSDQPHQPVGEHQGRRPLRQAHRVRRQARRAAHDPAAPGRRHPHERNRLRRSREVDRHQRRRRRRQARSRLHRHRPERRRRTSSTRRRACSGTWTTGSTRPTTRSASAGRRQASCASRPAPNGGQWGLASDDDGKPWFVDAGGERGPMNFQYPIHYGGVHAVPAPARPRRPAPRRRRRRPPPIRTARRAWRTASRRISRSSGPRPASATCRAASAARACRRRT